jgi:hypothetical protein
VSDEHSHANHHGDAENDDRDKESAHRLSSSNGFAHSRCLADCFYISGSLKDAWQRRPGIGTDAASLSPWRYWPLLASRTTKRSRCEGLRLPAVPTQAKAPPGESGAFWGSKDWGDRPASQMCLSTSDKGSKTTTPPERSMFARRRCRKTGYAIPQYQYVGPVRKRFNGPKGLRGRDENSRATCRGEKARP